MTISQFSLMHKPQLQQSCTTIIKDGEWLQLVLPHGQKTTPVIRQQFKLHMQYN